MILDTSALLALLTGEPEAERFAAALGDAEVIRMSAVAYTEAAAFIDRRADAVRRSLLDTFVKEFGVRVEDVTAEQARTAREAFDLFGKGRHRASLNFGDCFTYALAKSRNEPVLFKGRGFGLTDLGAAA